MMIFVSVELLDYHLKKAYLLLSNKNYKEACKVINIIIYNINYALFYEFNKNIISYLVDECYRCLLDFAFKRYISVHNRIRDMHYKLIDDYNDNKFDITGYNGLKIMYF